jgi:transposase
LKAASQKAVAGLLKLSWDEIHGIMERAVQRGLGRRRAELVGEIGVARMIKRRFENVITYLRHHITNASSESINAKIQWVKYTARGFRNQQNFVHAIYFHCGGLDLTPEATK